MESRSLFYLIARLLNVLLTVLDNNTLIVLIHLYTKEIVIFIIIENRRHHILNISPILRIDINYHIAIISRITSTIWI